MKIRDFQFFADENLLRGIIEYLRGEGFEVKSVIEEKLEGSKDEDLMPIAYQENRVIVTQDSDFGALAFTKGLAYIGILYLRPGHFPSSRHIASLEALFTEDPDLLPPFIITIYHSGESIRIRIRNEGKSE